MPHVSFVAGNQIVTQKEREILSLGPLDTLLGFHLRRASFVFSPDHKATKGVTPGWFSIMSVVAANSAVNQKDVSVALKKDPGNLAPLIDTMVQKGLLDRTVDPADRRARVLTLTPQGQKKLDATLALVQALESRMLKGFSREERTVLTRLLKRIHMPAAED